MSRISVAVVSLLLAASAHAAVEVTFNSTGGSIDSGTSLGVTVRSTDSTPREVRPIHLEVPSAILLGSRPQANGPATTLQTSESGTKDLDAGSSVEQSVFLAPLSWKETLAPRALFFRSQDLPVYSIVEYSESLDGPHTVIRQKHSLRVTGPMVGIAFGGFLGVMLAVLFTFVYARSKGEPTPGWKQQAFIVLTGLVTVVIVALVRNADDTALKNVGVVFAIGDYRGGVIVGLLFQPIAKKLSEWILGTKQVSPQPAD